ncbi:calcium/sodium antiporter [Puniceicoccus vermicola]|uniref:Calcium/sodium antiporter n=1 Tax=Puniceicoccus vermicola TaxID=388746 RepID=A0A7X1AVT2_9BACT|nr:calcium/sodium antiporter [Puniceicoccus vermicola]MBC2600684.1 calcium/sodium antiporter [Puniceicoccus vermicola]
MTTLSAVINVANLPGLVLALIIIGGLCFLMVGGDWLCRGSASLAIRLNVAPVVVGLTVVSIATSTPELFTALVGVVRDQPGLAIGNVLGSNAANMGLILGAAALITPISVHYRLIRWEIPILLGVTVLFAVLVYLGSGITRVGGIILLCVTAGYLIFIVQTSKGSRIEKEIEEEIPSPIQSIWLCAGLIVVGTFFLWLGADLLVDAATESALRMGVSETLVGITVVAIGTSLPELGATIAAAVRKQSGIIVGNIIGSNLFNLMLICGVVGTALPFPVDPMLMRLEIPMLIVFTGIFAWFVVSQRKVSRMEGGLLIALYAAFIIFSSVSQTGGFEAAANEVESAIEALP